MTTPYDLSTMNTTPASSTDLLETAFGFSSNLSTITMSPDGTRLYYSTNSIVNQGTNYYTLSTPWDVSTKRKCYLF